MRASNNVVSARPRRSVAAAIALGVAAATVLVFGPPSPAHAAVIDRAITGVTISPTRPAQTSQLTTNISWCVPDATKKGDTFTLTLSSHLRNLPTSFTLPDPTTKQLVATATISRANPALVTFTMTAYAQSHTDVCGTAYVRSDFDGVSTPSGKTTAFTSVSGDGRKFTTGITPTGTFGVHTQPVKYGTWTRADQGRTTPRDFLVWHVDTPTGPFSSAGTTDSVPKGQTWRFDCTTLKTYSGTLDANGNLGALVAVKPVSKACTTTGVAIGWPAQSAKKEYRVEVSASIPAATGTLSAQRVFSNKAAVAVRVGAKKTGFTAAASVKQAAAGGQGNGKPLKPGIVIHKGDITGAKGDTTATAAKLSRTGSANLVYVITNTGNDVLIGLHVADRVLAGGTVKGLTCDFSKLGGPAKGTSFSGKLPVRAKFTCTAALTGVKSGTLHHDIGYVSARGVGSGVAVKADNSYYAK